MAKITKIPAKVRGNIENSNSFLKKKVCAYARVSTNSDEQFTSYEAQVDYYTKYIKARPDWEFVGVYADEGISGTKTKNRTGFNNMIQDALAGKIDLIVTKSISRFARNTVDTLTNIRKLKEKGIEVYFEKENIHTLDNSGELLLTIMSSLAQEESRSISENVTWGHRTRFENGKFSIAYSTFLGYKKGEDGSLEVDKEEAEIVRTIYRKFLDGLSTFQIASYLNEKKIQKPNGLKKQKWTSAHIKSILSNEKYKGDALLQKTVTIDFLSKKVIKNDGRAPQYYVRGSHEAIINEDDWALVQLEMRRRNEVNKNNRKSTSNHVFSSKLVCGDCGWYYGSKIWHSTDKGRKMVWQCNKKFDKSKPKCKTPHLVDDDIKKMFMKAYRIYIDNRGKYIDDLKALKEIISNTTEIDERLKSLAKEIQSLEIESQELISRKDFIGENIAIYAKKYAELEDNYNKAVKEVKVLEEERDHKIYQSQQIDVFINDLTYIKPNLLGFDEVIFRFLIEKAVVYENKTIKFVFKTGQEIEVEWEE